MKYIFTLVVLFTLIGCRSKDEGLNPDFTVGLTGIYPLTLYQVGTQATMLPANNMSGQFEMTKIDLTHMRAKLTMTYGGYSNLLSSNDFEVKRDATNPALYNAFIGTKSVGTMTAADIDFNGVASDGTVTRIKAKR